MTDISQLPNRWPKLAMELTSQFKDWYFQVKRDGCIDIRRGFNGVEATNTENEDVDYLHICDIGEFIDMLQKVKAKAKAEFGEDWPS